jgi:hypothetical protein
MLRWGAVLFLGVPVVMAALLWAADARSPWQLLAPFVPFLLSGLWVARTHAREVVLTADSTLRATTVLGRRVEAPLGRVRTRWARVPGAAAHELVMELPDGPHLRVFQYPAAHTRRLTEVLRSRSGTDS